MTESIESGSPEPDDEGDAPNEDDPEHQPRSRPRPRIPPSDPASHEIGKRFLIGDDGRQAPLVVTVTDGLVGRDYAPADLIGKLVEKIAAVLKGMGGGFSPMLSGAFAGESMHLVFRDPDPLDAQVQLPVEFTLVEAQRVAELIPLEGDQLFAHAVVIGPPMTQYAELARTVQSEGITLRWTVRGSDPQVLDPERARRQHSRLSEPPQTVDRPITANGTLYRVITESTREGYRGSVGLHLFSWSARPPGESRAKRPRVLALYESRDVESQIKEGLVGESVEARLVVRHAVPGTSIDPDAFDLVLTGISRGPAEDSAFGVSFLDDDA